MPAQDQSTAAIPRLDFGLKLEIEMLTNIRTMLEQHAEECPRKPKAILLNPANHRLLGWDEVLGLPVVASERAKPMSGRLVCGAGRAGVCEQGDLVWDEEGKAYVFEPFEGS
jgi:hypothetical protein